MAEVRLTGFVNGINPNTGQGKPPELRYTQNGTPHLTFTLAEGHGKKQADGTWKNEASTFWQCTAFGQLADTWGQIQPGALVEVIGRTETRTYTKQDGSTGYHFGVTVEFMRHSPRTKNQGYNAPPQGNGAPQADPWANQSPAQNWGQAGANPEPPF